MKRKEDEHSIPMLAEHIEAFREFAMANQTVLIFRPVNPNTPELYAQGAAGKTMQIKGKSALNGHSLKGLIPENAKWSKIGSRPADVEHFNELNQQAIGEEEVKSIALKDSSGREVSGVVDKEGNPVLQGGKPVFVVSDPSGKMYIDGTDTPFHKTADQKLEPITVLAYPDGRIITADYDLFTVGTLAKPEDRVVSPQQGVASSLEHALVTALAEDTKVYRAVSHASEANNPHAEQIAGDHIVFTPDGKVSTLNNQREIKSLIASYQKQGLNFPMNEQWRWQIDEKGCVKVEQGFKTAALTALAVAKFKRGLQCKKIDSGWVVERKGSGVVRPLGGSAAAVGRFSQAQSKASRGRLG